MSATAPNAFAPWQQRIYARHRQRSTAGRLGHALLFAGPRSWASATWRSGWRSGLLCNQRAAMASPAASAAAAICFEAGTHPDYQLISFIPNKEGTRLRTEIVIEQIRELSDASRSRRSTVARRS
jgi:DNA polymerase-3 subunit delta'